jgi:hypothetical protein
MIWWIAGGLAIVLAAHAWGFCVIAKRADERARDAFRRRGDE